MVVAAEHIRILNKYEKSILNALERGMKHYAWVPLEQIKIATKLSESEVNYRLARLIEWVWFGSIPCPTMVMPLFLAVMTHLRS